MKILFYTNVYPDEKGSLGGIFIHNQAIALRNSGNEVAVLFLDFRSLRNKRTIGFSKYKLDGINVFRYSFPCGPIYFLINAVGPQLTKNAYKRIVYEFGEPDLIYSHFGGSAKLIQKTSHQFDVPYVVIEHDSGILTGKITDKKLKNRIRAYNDASAVIAVSLSLKRQLQKLTKNVVHVVPNIIPNYMFENQGKDQKVNFSDFIFISVGNLKKSKSFDLTIQAFAIVVRENPNVRLIIVGDGPERKRLGLLVQQLNIQKFVEFKGIVPNNKLPVLLNNCDCFVLPSKFETFGVVYLEAMACGLPVIATRCGGPDEFVNDSNGILIDVDDQAGLALAMKRMIKSSDFKSNRIKEYAYSISSSEAVVRKLENIFEKI